MTAAATTATGSAGGRLRASALLFGAAAITLNLTTACHELGHVIVDRINGLDASIVLEPFRSSYVRLGRPFPDSLTGWPEAAGPLANVTVGLVLLLGVWRWRHPALLPLLIWAPMALLQESANALVQLALREEGTDWDRLIDAGFQINLVLAIGILGLLAGLGLLIPVLPIAGVDVRWPWQSRLAVIGAGLAGYPALSLVISPVLGDGHGDATRNLALLVFFLLIGVVVVIAMRFTHRAVPPRVWLVDSAHVAGVLAGASLVVLLFLVG